MSEHHDSQAFVSLSTPQCESVTGQRQLLLLNRGHKYVFRFNVGDESKVLDGLLEMARDPESSLDWFDAAVLTHQMGQQLSEQLQRMRSS